MLKGQGPQVLVGPRWDRLELADGGIVVLNTESLILQVNTEATRLLDGLDNASVGYDFWDLLQESTTEQYEKETVDALHKVGHHAFVAHDVFRDTWLKFSFRVCPQGYVVNLKDITKRQNYRREEAITEHRSQLIFLPQPQRDLGV